MAQTGYTPLQIYSSSTAAATPTAGNLTNSTLGSELAINITDGKLFYKDNANVVQVIGWKTVPTTAGGTGLTSYTAGDLLYYATGTTLAKLTIGASTTVLTSSGSAPQWTAQSALSVGEAANLKSNATTGVMQITGPAAGATRVMTIPNANFTVARTDAAQTFSGLQTFGGGISSTGATLTSSGLIVTASEAYSELYSSGGIGSNARVRFRAVYTGGGSGYGGSFQLETRTSSNVYNTGALTVTDAGNISTTGGISVGTTTTAGAGSLFVNSQIATYGSQLNIYSSSDYEFVQRNPYKMLFYVNNASVVASLSITGVWTNASDARYKENIADSQYGLSTVMALKPRIYNLIDQADKPQIGFIAQEVLDVVPEVVESVYNSITEQERYTLAYTQLIPVLTKAIQEQQSMIDALQSRLVALENK